MRIHKLKSLNAFVVFDLDDAPVSTGIVRQGPTILTSGASDLARALTYSYASLGVQRGGASAGINAPDDERATAVAAFVTEIGPLVEAGTFLPDAAKGVSEGDLSSLRAHDPRHPVRLERTGATPLADELIALGAVAGAEAAGGPLERRTVTIEGFTAASLALVDAVTERGARVVGLSTPKGSAADPAGFTADALRSAWAEHKAELTTALNGGQVAPGFKVLGVAADVLFTGSKLGAIDHKGAEFVTATTVVPTATLPITARALAMMRRSGAAVLPDFVVLLGPLLAAWAPAGSTAEDVRALTTSTVTDILAEVATHPEGHLLGACVRAEAFLSTWQSSLPFGRPLAA